MPQERDHSFFKEGAGKKAFVVWVHEGGGGGGGKRGNWGRASTNKVLQKVLAEGLPRGKAVNKIKSSLREKGT